VNPSSSETYSVTLGGTYHALDGTAVTAVTLAPDSAAILTN